MSVKSYFNGNGKVMEGEVNGSSGQNDSAEIYGSGLFLKQTIEEIQLGGKVEDFSFKQAGNRLAIYKGSTLIAKTGLQPDWNGTQILFTDGAVVAKYNSQNLEMRLGGRLIPMDGESHTIVPVDINQNESSQVSANALLYLAGENGDHGVHQSSMKSFITGNGKVMEGEVNGSSGQNDSAEIYGSGLFLKQTIEEIQLGGKVEDFSFKQAGNRLAIYKGSTLIAKTGLQSDPDGTQILFTDGAVAAKYNSQNLEMRLGGRLIPMDGESHSIVPVDINQNESSQVSIEEAADFLGENGNSSHQSVTMNIDNKGSIDPSSQFPIDAGNKDYVFIDSIDQPNNVIISNFSRGDSIDISLDDVAVTTDGKDAIITTVNSGVVSQIILTGIVDSVDNVVCDVESLQAALGYSVFA